MVPFTYNKPKAFVPVQGTPLVYVSLRALVKGAPQIDDFTIITGCFHEYWESKLSELEEICHPRGITLLNNAEYDSTGAADSLQLAVKNLIPACQEIFCGGCSPVRRPIIVSDLEDDGASDEICVVYGDVLFTETVVQKLFDGPSPVIALNRDFRRSKQDFNYNCIELVTLEHGKVSTIGTETSTEFALGEYMGLCLLPLGCITPISNSLPTKASMAQFLQELSNQRAVSAAFFDGNWKEINSYDDLLAAHSDVYFLPNIEARKKYVQNIGHRLLSEANDIKRPLDLVAKEMGLESSVLEKIKDGTMDIDTAQKLLRKFCRQYPVPMASLCVEPDDTLNGVLCTSAEASEASKRVLTRPNRDGDEEEYYEYRDTAMSRLAPFRPEWIQMLRVVHDDDPDNPDVVYNKGHLLLQLTFFVGPVNFYYSKHGTKVCEPMNTGDSNWIAPFVPHSFCQKREFG